MVGVLRLRGERVWSIPLRVEASRSRHIFVAEEPGRPQGKTRGRPSITRSVRHYDIRCEGAFVHHGSDDLGLGLLADLEPDPDPVRASFQRARIADTAEFRVELERGTWRRAGYRL